MSDPFNESVVEKYLKLMCNDLFHRYWSWDHCFNAFSNEIDKGRLSLHLGFYLASWGMYRGSGGLLQKNHQIHEKAVEIITSPKFDLLRCNDKEVSRSQIPTILNLKYSISSHYNSINFIRGGKSKNVSDTDTLLSKVILGTTGCVPAYDRFFIAGLKKCKIKSSKFNAQGLEELFEFTTANEPLIKKAQKTAKEKTNTYYPIMKIVDMYFWQIGYDSKI